MPDDKMMKILIIDDIPESTDLLRIQLENYGYKVFVAPDGPTALATISRIKPDLILLDIVMPTLDGFAVAKRLKADPATKNIPIVMLTIKDRPDDIQNGLDVGAYDYVLKPFHLGLLVKRIQRIMHKNQEGADRN